MPAGHSHPCFVCGRRKQRLTEHEGQDDVRTILSRTPLRSEHHRPAPFSKTAAASAAIVLTAPALSLRHIPDASLGPEPLPRSWRETHLEDIRSTCAGYTWFDHIFWGFWPSGFYLLTNSLNTLDIGNPKVEGFGPKWFRLRHLGSWLGEAAPDLPFPIYRQMFRHLGSELPSVPAWLFPLPRGTWLSKAVFKYLSEEIRYSWSLIKYTQPITMVTRYSALLPTICQYAKHTDIWAKVWKLLPNTENNLLPDISHVPQSMTAAVALHFFSQQ